MSEVVLLTKVWLGVKYIWSNKKKPENQSTPADKISEAIQKHSMRGKNQFE